jgi:hypothetical protein
MGRHHVVAEMHLTTRQLTAAARHHKDMAQRNFMMGAVAFRMFVEPDALVFPIFDTKVTEHLEREFDRWFKSRPKCWEQRVLDDREKKRTERKANRDG